MRRGKTVGLIVIALVALAGCASRLGYPGGTVGMPTPVTLFSKVPAQGTITKNMNYLARDLWSSLYEKKFQEVLNKIDPETLQRTLNINFAKRAARATALFAPSSTEVQNIGVDYGKTKSDPKTYSGFDFSQYKDTIPTQLILAFTIDEWGLIAAQRDTDNGPYVSLTMQLVDKDTNESLWKYSYLFQTPMAKDEDKLTRPAEFQDILEHLIAQGVDAYFKWLGA